MTQKQIQTFLFLDDDNDHPDKIRDPHKYYPLIGADKILDILKNSHTVHYVNTVEEAQEYMTKHGCPNFISFDNDLQKKLEGKDLAKWIIEQDLESSGNFIPKDFQFFVHSQNINAKTYINSFLSQYLEFKNNLDSVEPTKPNKIKM